MDNTDNLLSVHQFIKGLKAELNYKFQQYKRFNEVGCLQIENSLPKGFIPTSESPIQKFIHGDIFEYCVQKAAGHFFSKDDPWIKFKELYPNIRPKQRKQYHDFMEKAGHTTWALFEKDVIKMYGRKKNSICYTFGYHIHNNTFPILTRKLEADVFVNSLPNIVCDIKYSTMKKDAYEDEYLVHALMQVLIYSLALNLEPSTLHLRVLVFYGQTAEAVLYGSEIHKDHQLVKGLYKKLKGKNMKKNKIQRVQENEFTEDEEDTTQSPAEILGWKLALFLLIVTTIIVMAVHFISTLI